MWLVVGLGNPGKKYAGNRHNIGFMVADELAARARASFSTKLGGELASCELAGQRLALLKPMEFMNLSGRAVQRAAAFFQVAPAQVLVVHDEIDLALGRLQLKIGGGHGGHNGLRSIHQELGSPDYLRIRCGVGRPAHAKVEVSSYVLGDFAAGDEATLAQILVKEAADCAQLVLEKGPTFAMNQCNKRGTDRQ